MGTFWSLIPQMIFKNHKNHGPIRIHAEFEFTSMGTFCKPVQRFLFPELKVGVYVFLPGARVPGAGCRPVLMLLKVQGPQSFQPQAQLAVKKRVFSRTGHPETKKTCFGYPKTCFLCILKSCVGFNVG